MIAINNNFIGYVHAIAHGIGGVYGVTHGKANAIVLPYVMEAFGKSAPEYIVSFIKILVENGRIITLCECIAEFNELLRISENRIIAQVYYVEPLTDEQKKALTDKLGSVSGKTVDAVYIQDNSLIGGIKVVSGRGKNHYPKGLRLKGV